MYIAENLSINSGVDIPADGTVKEFDLQIKSRWCKIFYVKIVQLTAGPMNITFDIFEKSNVDEGVRSNLYLNVLKISPDLLLAGRGSQFGISYTGNPLPYCDRNDISAERVFNLHCRLTNEHDGTVSDFAVSIKVGDMMEAV